MTVYNLTTGDKCPITFEEYGKQLNFWRNFSKRNGLFSIVGLLSFCLKFCFILISTFWIISLLKYLKIQYTAKTILKIKEFSKITLLKLPVQWNSNWERMKWFTISSKVWRLNLWTVILQFNWCLLNSGRYVAMYANEHPLSNKIRKTSRFLSTHNNRYWWANSRLFWLFKVTVYAYGG